MTILNKALTRPAALWGVPLVPLLFTLCILTLAAVWSRFYWLLLLLIPAFIELRRLAKEDIHFFDLKLLAFKTRGNARRPGISGQRRLSQTSTTP